MSFLHPWAFAGLASILLLILLSFWRLRPARAVVPSVRLWRLIPDRLPPVRALRRPRATFSLLLQMLAASALVLAMAGPGLIRRNPAPRRIAVVVDTSVYMRPRADDVRRELAKLDPSDDIVLIQSPSLVRRQGLGDSLVTLDVAGDPGPALDLAASEAKQIVFVGDRAPAWSPPPGVALHLALVGGPLRNVGIVDADVRDGRLFVRLTGPSEIKASIDGRELTSAADTVHLIQVSAPVTRIEVRLPDDDFAPDDRVVLEREAAVVDVGFEGRPDARILAAIESNPAARVVRGGTPRVVIRVGAPQDGVSASIVVEVDPMEGVESKSPPGELSIASHPLLEGVEVEDLVFLEVGKLEGPIGTPLIFSGGSPIAAVRPAGKIVLAVRYANTGWPARPSFPIFWDNVLKYAASGLVAWRATGLLDEAASRPGFDRKSLDPAALGARPLVPLRTDLAGGSIVFAALLLGVLWLVERRQAGKE